MSLDQAIQQFIEQGRYLRNWSPKTVRCYRQCLAIFQRSVRELPTKTSLNAFIVQMRQEGRSPGGCNVCIRTVNSFLTWLHEDGRIPEPLKVKLLRAERTAITTPSGGDLTRLLLYHQKGRAWVILALILDTGLRIDEALGLERCNVDLERLMLKVAGKGRKERLVPISSTVRKHLWRWLRQSSGRYVFSTRQGGRLSYRNAYRDIKGVCQAVGIESHPHAFRHCFAVSYIRNGGDIYRLSRILGHASITTTQLYLRSMGLDAVKEGHEQLSPLAMLRP
jgi:integrase/recombinase XerD